jgi:hypothetical protein
MTSEGSSPGDCHYILNRISSPIQAITKLNFARSGEPIRSCTQSKAERANRTFDRDGRKQDARRGRGNVMVDVSKGLRGKKEVGFNGIAGPCGGGIQRT